MKIVQYMTGSEARSERILAGQNKKLPLKDRAVGSVRNSLSYVEKRQKQIGKTVKTGERVAGKAINYAFGSSLKAQKRAIRSGGRFIWE